MKRLFNWIAGSFEYNGKSSSRKLSAFWMLILTTYMELRFGSEATLIELVSINLCAVLILLGIVTIHDIAALKNGNNQQTDPNQPPKQ
jgi:hypothetical protein